MRRTVLITAAIALVGTAATFGARSILVEPASATPPPAKKLKPDHLPDRLLDCTLGRATNIDPSRLQDNGEVIYEGAHRFRLFLPAADKRTTPPPDATEPPEPVDPETRIVSDKDMISVATSTGFERVIDYWPDRVELVSPIDPPQMSLLIVHPINEQTRQATLFLTRAKDLATFDLQHVYQGGCTVYLGDEARKMAGLSKKS